MWSVSRKVGTPIPSPNIHVRAQGPWVVMLFGTSRIELTTPEAHKMAFQLIRTADNCILEQVEFVTLTINNADIEIPPQPARQLGAALLRKSDKADNFQITHRKRAI